MKYPAMNRKTQLRNGYEVSTVSLPSTFVQFTVYETMVFPPNSSNDVHCRRTRDRRQADANHAEAVRLFAVKGDAP